LTIDEAKDLTINEIIERENANSQVEYQKQINKDYEKFEKAWNSFEGLIIKEDNVEAIIPQLTRDSKMIYCCLSSSSDHEGHIFYLLLKYLSNE
jgi:pyruvate-formate lyase